MKSKISYRLTVASALLWIFTSIDGGQVAADIIINGPEADWISVQYGIDEPITDQQAGGSEPDLIGSASDPSFYVQFDDLGTPSLEDGTLAFRLRLAEDKNPAGYKGALFIGIDANGDGAIDIFAGVDNSGSSSDIGLWDSGTGANTSPSTTSIASSPSVSYTQTSDNYKWGDVDLNNDADASSYDIDGGGKTDQFLSFSIDFQDLVDELAVAGITINENTGLSFVAGTATQNNSINSDLNGVNGGINSTSTWTSLGAISSPVSIPEPSTMLLLGIGLTSLLACPLLRRSVMQAEI